MPQPLLHSNITSLTLIVNGVNVAHLSAIDQRQAGDVGVKQRLRHWELQK